MLNDLFVNFCVLCTSTFLVGWTMRSLASAWTWTQILLRAVLTVASSFALIVNAVPLGEGGMTLDLRAVPVALATLGGGVPAGLTVALPLVLYALAQGSGYAGVQALHLALLVGLCAWARRGAMGPLDDPLGNPGVRPWAPFVIFGLTNLPLAAGGLLTAQDPGHLLGATALLTLVQAAGMVAAQTITLTQIQALRKADALANLAYTDKLTGVGNRRALDEALQTPGAATHVLLLDLDHFKGINDTHGHDGGDRVLEAAAAALRETLGAQGQVYRFGGEEFAALLRGPSTGEAAAQAQALRAAVAEQAAARSGQAGVRVTVSAGLAGVHPAHTALERADALLYTAKRAGRDRLEVEGGAPAPLACAAAS